MSSFRTPEAIIPPGKRWDVLCRVVDHYGDAGVTWRLCRQLAAQHQQQVHLWIDNPERLAALSPSVHPLITVHTWPDDHTVPDQTPDVVVETFGGGLPSGWETWLATQPKPVLWINLEHLSAEAWVSGCHGLSTLRPSSGLRMHWFFPGFGHGTGGLLREPWVDEQARAQEQLPCAPLNRIHHSPGPPATLSMYLFAYDHPSTVGLVRALARSDQRWQVTLPPVASTEALVRDGVTQEQHGHIAFNAAPFVPQSGFDGVLASHDLVVVRGEDSWVRAQWAAVPMLWQAYPQQDGAHEAKVEAFASLWRGGPDRSWQADEPVLDTWHQLMRAINGMTDFPSAAGWARFIEGLPQLAQHAQGWRKALCGQPDLCQQLVRFATDRGSG